MLKIRKLRLKFLLKMLESTKNPKDFDKVWHRLDSAKYEMRQIIFLMLNDQFSKEQVNSFYNEIIRTKKFVIEEIGDKTHVLLVHPTKIKDLILSDLEKTEKIIKKWVNDL